MRTTLNIDDDVLMAAKEIARRQNVTAGELISRLLRQGLTGTTPTPSARKRAPRRNASGFRTLPSRGNVVSNDLVDALRNAEGV